MFYVFFGKLLLKLLNTLIDSITFSMNDFLIGKLSIGKPTSYPTLFVSLFMQKRYAYVDLKY